MNHVMDAKEAAAYLTELDRVWITPEQAAKCLNCSPQTLRIAAKQGTLGINHLMCGRSLKIFTNDLIKKIGG